MRGQPFILSAEQRGVVDRAIRAHATYRGWTLHAINVRTNHVHIVCTGSVPPERVMGEFKAWASRALRGATVQTDRIWTRHGSTRWLDTEPSFQRAVEYVLNGQ